jgi:hypothetical protein
MRVLCFLLGVAAGCSEPAKKTTTTAKPGAGSADGCDAAIDKVFAAAARRGATVDDGSRSEAIEECRKNPDHRMVKCLKAAKDDADVEGCFAPPGPQKGEPYEQLHAMTESLRTYFFVHETFTDQKVALTPAQACCKFPTKKCPPEKQPNYILSDVLQLDLSKEREFQYRFESTSKKAVIEAVGDRDCDGNTVTYRRELEWRSDGNMHITVIDPKEGAD